MSVALETAARPRDVLTIGIDIGTSSVKAVAVDSDGTVVRRSRVQHAFRVPTAQRLEHDARCWRDGPLEALRALGDDIEPAGISVAAMVPSLAAVDGNEVPISEGLLYGDERGGGGHPGGNGELTGFLEWLAAQYPNAAGYRPAQAVANAAISGDAVISKAAAAACWPLFDFKGWNRELVEGAGAAVEQMPRLVSAAQPAAHAPMYRDCVLEGGTIDAMAEQIVAGADNVGDVLVICGTTLIVWAVTDSSFDIPGYFPIPHTAPGRFLFGGPSNAGGLFLNWASGLLSADAQELAADEADRVPLWVPYPRGERAPINDNDRRASLHGLDLTHRPASIRRAAFEAAGFVARRLIEAAPTRPQRIVATGGGTRVGEWIATLANCTQLPVAVASEPEGAARGAAFLARIAAGIDANISDGARWARTSHTVEPDARGIAALQDRYGRWAELAS